MKDKKLSDLTVGDVSCFLFKLLIVLAIFIGILLLVSWLTSC